MAPSVRRWLAGAVDDSTREATGQAHSPQAHSDEGDGLSPQQREAVVQGAAVIRRVGGVLLADAVGLGKTRTAMALARRIRREARRLPGGPPGPALIVAPARLGATWRRAVADVGWEFGRDARLTTHYRLSRAPLELTPSVIIVDEAHRFRNPTARRTHHLSLLTAKAPVVLATATPVCSRAEDLYHLLRLFLTDDLTLAIVGLGLREAFEAHEAGEFDLIELLECVMIRRRIADFGPRRRPRISFEVLPYEAPPEEAWIWQHLEATLHEMTGAVLDDVWPRPLRHSALLRQWESGPEALARSLTDLIHYHHRWLTAAHQGRRLSREEFRDLFGAVDPNQGVFPFVFQNESAPTEAERTAAREDLEILEELAEKVRAVRGDRGGVIGAILDRVRRDRDEPFLIFSAYRTMAQSIYEALVRQDRRLRAGLVMSGTARATGLGRVSAEEVLERFLGTPTAQGPHHQRLRVLVATDCISEGVNLQGCRTMILTDLPSTPLRLEQRVGRIARQGSTADEVSVLLPRPAGWTDSLGMRRRLHDRVDTAQGFGAGHPLTTQALGHSRGDSDAGDETDEHSTDEPLADEPLAALTRYGRLCAGLADDVCGGKGDQTDNPDKIPAFAQTGPRSDADHLWVRLRILSRGERHLWIWVRPGRPVTVRLFDQLPGLVGLGDDPRPVHPWEPRGPAWDRARDWMDRRRTALRAARVAPTLMGPTSAPVRAWRVLRDVADPSDLPDLRRALLRPHSPGVLLTLEAFLDRPPALHRYVESLIGPESADEIVLHPVAALLYAPPVRSPRHREPRSVTEDI